jgi:hypothetical protein
MANYRTIIDNIEAAANAWLPPEFAFGYEVAHDAADPSAPEDLTMVDAGSAEFLANWRRRLTKYVAANHPGASDDLAAWPASGRYLIAEIVHLPTGARAVKAYSYETIRNLATNGALTPAQKRTQVRNALNQLYLDCQARVAAIEGGG